MVKVFKNVKGKFFSKVSYLMLALFIVLVSAVPAFAVGTENAAVTAAFVQLQEDLVATMAPIAIAAVSIAVVLFAWRYGRKIFTTIAK